MQKLLIATGNAAKISMFRNMLSGLENVDLVFLSDLENVPESPDENWKTPEDNAFLKAKYYWDHFSIPTLADDAWFEVDALNWEPWTMARRWWWELPDSVSDEDWLEFFLDKIKDVDWDLLSASFPFSRCLYVPWEKPRFQTEKIRFKLSRIPRKPYKKWWPLSSLRVFDDWRHEMDVPLDDPLWENQVNREWLLNLLRQYFSDLN